MPGAQRRTDANSAGGAIYNTPNATNDALNNTVFANTLLVAVNGSIGTADSSCSGGNIHCAGNWQTQQGCPTVFVEGTPGNFTGNVDTCGHTRVGGSSNVFMCAGGAGALADSNPPMNSYGSGDGATGGAPANANTVQTVENYTIADVHAVANNDDPDDPNTLGSPANPPPNTQPRPVETLATDSTTVSNTPTVYTCSVIDALPSNFNWSAHPTGSPQPPDFATWARNPATWPEVQLSANFTLADLTVDAFVSSYEFTNSVTQASGLTQKEILQNLCYLANTVLEPLWALYNAGDPDGYGLYSGTVPRTHTMVITSGWRSGSGASQHDLGQAVDVQFLDIHGTASTGDTYYSRAQYIRDNIKFDQLILEWYARNPWIHISTNSVSLRNNVLTQTASNSYTSGLIKLG